MAQQVRQGGYRLINPLLECEIGEETIGNAEVMPSKNAIEDLIKARTKRYGLTHVSVYYRDLNNGPWFGINEREKFAAASLLKVPLMMTYLKLAEKDHRLLARRILYKKGGEDYNLMLSVKPSRQIVPGSSYSVDEMLYMLIVYSDNNANELLSKNVEQNEWVKTYHDSGVHVPSSDGDDYSVKEYASFFRILFNSSYLSRDMSEKALLYLSEVEFQSGIVAGVPPNTMVAHKYGERAMGDRGEIKQLHDCGIVYYPGNPYLLCIMTRGSEFATLDDMISEISHRIYQDIDFRFRQSRKK